MEKSIDNLRTGEIEIANLVPLIFERLTGTPYPPSGGEETTDCKVWITADDLVMNYSNE